VPKSGRFIGQVEAPDEGCWMHRDAGTTKGGGQLSLTTRRNEAGRRLLFSTSRSVSYKEADEPPTASESLVGVAFGRISQVLSCCCCCCCWWVGGASDSAPLPFDVLPTGSRANGLYLLSDRLPFIMNRWVGDGLASHRCRPLVQSTGRVFLRDAVSRHPV